MVWGTLKFIVTIFVAITKVKYLSYEKINSFLLRVLVHLLKLLKFHLVHGGKFHKVMYGYTVVFSSCTEKFCRAIFIKICYKTEKPQYEEIYSSSILFYLRFRVDCGGEVMG